MKRQMIALACVPFVYATGAAAQSRPVPWLDTPKSVAEAAAAAKIAATAPRPLPGPVYETSAFSRAVTAGTRTRTGLPGAGNFVQHARYAITARIDPATHTLTGSERVTYINNSGSTLNAVRVHLRQNAFAAESPRREPVIPTAGMKITRASVNGVPMTAEVRGGMMANRPHPGYRIEGTVMSFPLDHPLAPHDSAQLEFAWSYEVPLSPSDGRQGREDHVYFMGYWYPQVAVYDDVTGWVADPYLLEAEFYMDPADYDVRVTAPRGWVVGATGTLQNATAILTPATRARLADARRSGNVVTIAKPGVDAANAFTGTTREVTWHFVATDVRDFSWGTSDRYVWDATRALIERGGREDTVDIHSFYRISRPAAAWAIGGARYTRDAIQQLSKYLWPYPWPVMSSMEGVLTSGGMEYPMMTVMQPWSDTLSLAGDIMHETGHMWFPLQVGSNETRHPWMDEGFTQFNTAQAMRVLYGEPRSGGRPNDSEPGQRRQYTERARAGDDQGLMQHGDMFPQNLYNVMYYNKTSQILAALRGILGEDLFHRAFVEYGRRWIGKHPYPYDFFNTIEDVSKRDLSWFWVTWFYNAWPLDQAISNMTQNGDAMMVTIEDRGLAPMPVHLTVTRDNGKTERIDAPVDVWLTGKRTYEVRIPNGRTVTRIEIDAAGAFPDMERGNQLRAKAPGQ